MATITIQNISPDKKEEIRATAKSKSMTITGYIMHLIEKDKESRK